MEPIDISNLSIELYGFCGKMGSGKDYIANNIFLPKLPKKKTSLLAFADHLKIDVASKYSLKLEKLYNDKDSYTRTLLQHMGTEEGRDKYGKYIWINALGNWIKLLNQRGIERFIITDCRFINEINWIINNGGRIINIHAPDRNFNRLLNDANNDFEILQQLKSHISETEQDNMIFDNIINNTIDNADYINADVNDLIIKLIC